MSEECQNKAEDTLVILDKSGRTKIALGLGRWRLIVA